MTGFLDRYRELTLGEVFAGDSPLGIRDLGWMELPEPEFLRHVRGVRAAMLDRLPESPDEYVEGTTFLQAQAHRVWLTVRKASELMPCGRDGVLLNLGGYPFAVERVLRDYLGRECRIVSTYNQHLSGEVQEMLLDYRIEAAAVNLDPYVAVGDAPPQISERIPLGEGTVDLVLMAHVIEHLYHPLAVLREAARVLKPGGRILVTTDNAFLLGAFLQFLGDRRFVHEPVEGTAAMAFHAWRGHVRFYSGEDLQVLLTAAGFDAGGREYYEVHYNSEPEEQFVRPNVTVPEWRARLLGEFPEFRNEIFVWGVKGGG